MILSAQSIQQLVEAYEFWEVPENRKHYSMTAPYVREDSLLGIKPFESRSKKIHGLSYGLTAAGYDIRIGNFGKEKWDHYNLKPGEFLLAASLEWVKIPTGLQVIVHDKSTLARQGLALQNTVLEPGWYGHITLELSNHGPNIIPLRQGQPIAQLIFHQLDRPTDRPYRGKYQDQGSEPVQAILEEDSND
jgi:dCTP deaminase